MRVPFIDLPHQHNELMPDLLAATEKVLRSGQFILGEEVEKLETELAAFTGAKHAISLHSCTDALVLALKYFGIGTGDEVITAPNSFLASASSIWLAGATIRFADVGDDYNLDPVDVERRITPKTKAIIVVHLTGRPAKMAEILAVAKRHNLRVIEDCAQAIGASYENRHVGLWGDVGCISLHPLKNLNACGDGGAIITNDATMAEWFRKARNHGLRDRDTCEFWSYNVRLDSLQAALIRVKLPHLTDWNNTRRSNAERYRKGLVGISGLVLPVPEQNIHAVYHLFVILHDRRNELQKYLADKGIDTKVHYPIPIHLQPAASSTGYKKGDFPECERQSDRILSLPVQQYLTTEAIDFTIDAIRSFK